MHIAMYINEYVHIRSNGTRLYVGQSVMDNTDTYIYVYAHT